MFFKTVCFCNEVAGIDLKVMMQSDGNKLIEEENLIHERWQTHELTLLIHLENSVHGAKD